MAEFKTKKTILKRVPKYGAFSFTSSMRGLYRRCPENVGIGKVMFEGVGTSYIGIKNGIVPVWLIIK